MASTYGFLRQRPAWRSASARLCRPFGVAAGRDALGPELARRVRGEMDHGAMRVDVARAAALVHFAVSIGGLELDAHDHSVME